MKPPAPVTNTRVRLVLNSACLSFPKTRTSTRAERRCFRLGSRDQTVSGLCSTRSLCLAGIEASVTAPEADESDQAGLASVLVARLGVLGVHDTDGRRRVRAPPRQQLPPMPYA